LAGALEIVGTELQAVAQTGIRAGVIIVRVPIVTGFRRLDDAITAVRRSP
jgi:hypothetical protein